MTTNHLKTQAFDVPDLRDYRYGDIYGDVSSYTESEFNKKLREKLHEWGYDEIIDYLQKHQEVENQYDDKQTKKSCTRQGTVNVVNSQNLLKYLVAELEYEHISAKPMRLAFEKERHESKGILPGKMWSSLQSGIKQAKERGYIGGYATANSVAEAIEAINNLHFIYSGSKDWDWSKIPAGWVYKQRTDSRIVGHAFATAVAYDLEGRFFWAIDSSWRKFFKIPFDMWGTLYTRYALIDKDDAKLEAYKKSLENQETSQLREKRNNVIDETIERDGLMWNAIAQYPGISNEDLLAFREYTHQRANIMRKIKGE